MIKGDQREKAQKIIDRVRQIDPENPKVKQIGAFNAYMEGDSQKATDLAKDHLRDNPEDILSHQFFGALQADQGNLASGERHLSSAAYLSGGQQDISAQARAIRIQSHWLLYPLRFVDRIGGSTIWVGTIVAYFVLRALELRQFATILALTYLTFAIYSWIAPPLLSRWFDYRYGQIR